MRDHPHLSLVVSEPEAITLIVALAEYLYAFEDGGIDDIRGLIDPLYANRMLDASHASELKSRLERLLSL